ncbi:amidase signature domain-containing protein [Lipomyces kononenkoae]
MRDESEINLVEASIQDIRKALDSGSITRTELVARYLQKIASYDTRGPCLNSIPILNPRLFEEAAASDARRAAGPPARPLEGIPYTIKDGFKYLGMPVSAGSPAFRSLMPNEDAFIAAKLREAGAICIGKTNMPPMAAGGMQRGLYGRAESPYNLEYLTAAFSSGSSNGSATSTAASFAAFGLGTETVSSGRSPASNNGLVAYTPSRGIISCRGMWPLYPTCDVVVPQTRIMEDMFTILDVLTHNDDATVGDFWRDQPFVKLPDMGSILPKTYTSQADADALRGKRIGVPSMYIGGHDPKAKPIVVKDSVKELWQRARKDIEALGAEVVETDFPIITNYEDDSISQQPNNVVGLPSDWSNLERGKIIAYAWDDFLITNKDPTCPSLECVVGSEIFPKPPGYVPDLFLEKKNIISYESLVELVKIGGRIPLFDIPGVGGALAALEAQRKRDLEDWMDKHRLDAVVFPANGDVGKADIETNEDSAAHAHMNGVRYSNGNRALRHLGVPTVSVTMGIMSDTHMPVNLTFAGKAYTDNELLKFAYAYEQKSRHRVAPSLTPSLASDSIPLYQHESASLKSGSYTKPTISIDSSARCQSAGRPMLFLRGTVSGVGSGDFPTLEIFVDGRPLDAADVFVDHQTGQWTATTAYTPFEVNPPKYDVKLLASQIIVVVLGRSANGISAKLALVD